MKGKVLDYVIKSGEGYISGDDGERYTFNASEWMSNESYPYKGCSVDFVIEETHAVKVYMTHLQQSSQETSAAAVVSLVFGIMAVMFNWWSLMLPSLVAIISGHLARASIKNSNRTLGGDGLAIGGLILGYFSLVIYLIIITFFIGLIGSFSR